MKSFLGHSQNLNAKTLVLRAVSSAGRAVSFLFAVLPARVRLFIGDVIGVLWFDVFRIRRKVALENLKIAFPEKSEHDRIVIARNSLRSLGRCLTEFFLFPFFKRSDVPKYFTIHGLENLEAARAKDRGVLVLGLHLGNGDFGIAALSRLGYEISLISKNFKTKWLNDLWFGMRAQHGTQFIAPEKSSFQILRALKGKRTIFFVLDQYMGPPVGCRTMFFGKETGTAMGLALIAQRSESPVVTAYTFREADGRHVIVIGPEIPWQSSVTSLGQVARDEENITTMTQVYTDKLEEIVRRFPDQWMWIHRRWKNFG